MPSGGAPLSPPADEPPARRRSLSLLGLLSAAASLVAMATVAGFFGKFWWPLEIASGLRLQYFEAALAAAIVFAFARKSRQSALCAGLAAVNLAFILPFYFGAPAPPSADSLRAVLINVRTENTATERVLSFVEREDPDVLVLQEVNARWVGELAPLRQAFPYHVEEPEEDNFGIALYSKLPLDSLEVVSIGRVQLATIIARLRLEGRVLNIIATHPLPPGGSFYFELRNDQLAELAAEIGAFDGQVMVIGDLNMTPWSPYFRSFLDTAGLRDSRRGFGLQTSWPTFLPPLGLPIDHCLVSEAVQIHDRRVGARVGSDHWPLVIDFSVKP